MDVHTLVHQYQESPGHFYPHTALGGSSSAVFGNVYVQGGKDLSDAEQEQRERNALLTALAYNGMNTRRKQLSEQAAQYLEWIWRKRKEGGSGFADWLCDNYSVFWITGKPGSGKSTLVKYLAEHEDCRAILQQHSQRAWFIVHFYFDFRAGSSTANSLEGLLRSVIYQLVGASTIANKTVRSEMKLTDLGAAVDSLGRTDLQRIFRVACKAINTSAKVCAFVDGLDEYGGDHIEIIRMVDFLAGNGFSKLCIASRPEHVLLQHYQRRPHLKMQDHNLSTINAYVGVTLRGQVCHSDLEIEQLIDDVVSAAEGVILWVQLVTNHLIALVVAGGTPVEIYARLREFPKELNDAYERLLKSVKAEWQVESAVLLRLIQTGIDTTSLWDLSCAMAYLRSRGQLLSWPNEVLDPRSFLMRFRARTNSMVDVMPGPFTFPDQDLSVLPSGDLSRQRFLSRNTRVRLFHKTLDGYLSSSGWMFDALQSVVPAIPTIALWLELYSQCIHENDLSPAEYSSVCHVLASKHHLPDLIESEASTPKDQIPISLIAANVVSAVLDPYTNEVRVAFLECAIADYPTHMARHLRRDDGEVTASMKRAYTSLTMLLHHVKDRFRIFQAPLHACLCRSAWGAHSPLVYLGYLSPPQRANVFAISHRMTKLYESWKSEVITRTDSSYERLILVWLLKYYPVHCAKSLAALDDVADCAYDQDILEDDHRWRHDGLETAAIFLSNEVLQVVAPHLRRQGHSRMMIKPMVYANDQTRYVRTAELNSISSAGYNMLFLWLWVIGTPKSYEPGGSMDYNLTLLLSSGLNINDPCCLWGPLAHTFVQSLKIFVNGYPTKCEPMAIWSCLRRHGARMDIYGPHGSVLDTAKWNLEQPENVVYSGFTPYCYSLRHLANRHLRAVVDEIARGSGRSVE